MASVCAIIAVRNERPYLPVLLNHLRTEGIEAVFIDNGSDDGSVDILHSHLGDPVVNVIHLPYSGCFDLGLQLQAKIKLIESVSHDWIIHQDADEILQSPIRGESLMKLAIRADADAFTVVDFDEFVFIPTHSAGYSKGDYFSEGTSYYFFQPTRLRLNRMFKRQHFQGFGASGGHKIQIAEGRILESNILRHYIVLSRSHASSKYLARVFSNTDTAKGWHANRIGISEAALDYTKLHRQLNNLDEATSRDFSRCNPMEHHFWHW